MKSTSSVYMRTNFQLTTLAAIGLQYRFSSFQWVSTVPPILIVLAYKIYINRTFLPLFQYFSPTEEELRQTQVHSERADHKGHRLEKRFGHPALHMDLFTPMLHAKMTPLLSQVYSGKISNDKAKLDEYHGQDMDAQIVPGGITIAAISQNDLEYDPVLYQRDRGELDWDARSISSTTLMDNASTIHAGKPSFYASGNTSKLQGYDVYLAQGPQSSAMNQSQMDIEMTPIDSMDQPLLPHNQYTYATEHAPQPVHSQQNLISPDSSPQLHTPSPLFVAGTNAREAPLYRPQEQRPYSPTPSYHTESYHSGRSTPRGRALHTSQQWAWIGDIPGHPPPQQWSNASRSGTPVREVPWGSSSRPGSPVQQNTHPSAYHHSRQPTQASIPDYQQRHRRQESGANMAGRGTFGRA